MFYVRFLRFSRGFYTCLLRVGCVGAMADLTVNELLCFVWVRSDKLPRDHLHAAVHDFYTLEEVTLAKNILLGEFDKTLSGDLIKEARKKTASG